MTSAFDGRKDVEQPADLLKRICQGQAESQESFTLDLSISFKYFLFYSIIIYSIVSVKYLIIDTLS